MPTRRRGRLTGAKRCSCFFKAAWLPTVMRRVWMRGRRKTAERNGAAFYLTAGAEGCGMKTPVADEAEVRRQFTELAEKGAAGQTVRLRADHYSPSPFPFSQLVYAWQQDNEAVETLLTANTSPSDHVPAQAALHFSRAPMTFTGARVVGQ